MAPESRTDGPSTDAVLAARLARLDQPTLTALVADLWAARGFDTARENGVVVATDGDERTVVAPLSGSGVGSPSLPDRPVDVVVVPGGAPRGLDDGVEVVDAAALTEMLRYAVAPSVGRDLCERHLGAPPGTLSPPAAQRARAALDAYAARTVTALVLALLVGFSVVAALSGSGVLGANTGATAGEGTATGTASPTATPVDREPLTGAAAVPGLTRAGIQNLSALADAHESVLADQSFTAWIDVYRPRGGDPGAVRVQRDVDVAMVGDRYRATTNVEGPEGRTKTHEVYDDGSDAYVANWTDGGREVRPLGDGELPLPVFGRPAVLRRGLVSGYLQVRGSEVTAKVNDGSRTLYRLEGWGSSRTVSGVSDYSVAAMVDQRGFVRELEATFTLRTYRGSYHVRFEVTFGNLGNTSVDRPAWYEDYAGGGVRQVNMSVAPGVGVAGPALGTAPAGGTVAARPPSAVELRAPLERELLFSSRRYDRV